MIASVFGTKKTLVLCLLSYNKTKEPIMIKNLHISNFGAIILYIWILRTKIGIKHDKA